MRRRFTIICIGALLQFSNTAFCVCILCTKIVMKSSDSRTQAAALTSPCHKHAESIVIYVVCEVHKTSAKAFVTNGLLRKSRQASKISAIRAQKAHPLLTSMRANRDDTRSFWLDSARVQAETGRFSFMGGSTGPLSYHVSYNVTKQEITMTSAHESKQVVRSGLLPFLREKLLDTRADCSQVPFDFVGGFVGYLGYELKQDCYDARGETNRFQSPDADAQLLFADRILAWDHQEGSCYALCLVPRSDADQVRDQHMYTFVCAVAVAVAFMVITADM